VGIIVSSQLASYVDAWVPIGERVCTLRLKLYDRSLCVIQVCMAHNACAAYPDVNVESAEGWK